MLATVTTKGAVSTISIDTGYPPPPMPWRDRLLEWGGGISSMVATLTVNQNTPPPNN